MSSDLIITMIGMIILPLLGFFYNIFINKRFEDEQKAREELEDRCTKRFEDEQRARVELESSCIERFKTLFKRMDDKGNETASTYVRRDLYDRDMQFIEKQTDQKFASVLAVINTNLQNLENKVADLKDGQTKIFNAIDQMKDGQRDHNH